MSGTITRENCEGVWVPIMSEWDERDRFDEKMFAGNVRTLAEAGVQVIYTTGTDGEFYALTQEEFRRIVAAAVDAARGSGARIAIGTNATGARQVLEQISYCAEAGADAVMPAFPFWLELGEREWLPFLKECCRAAGPIGVMHYNTVRAKRVLGPTEYGICARELPPNFVGSKSAAAGFAVWCQLSSETPELVHLPMETSAVPVLAGGGKSFISATLGALNPRLAAGFYGLCRRGKWDEAMRLQMRLNRVEHEVCNQFFRRQGYRAGALSKALTRIGGRLATHNTMRQPYEAAPGHIIAAARPLVYSLLPELAAV